MGEQPIRELSVPLVAYGKPGPPETFQVAVDGPFRRVRPLADLLSRQSGVTTEQLQDFPLTNDLITAVRWFRHGVPRLQRTDRGVKTIPAARVVRWVAPYLRASPPG
jgi:hypothetical protein